MDHNTLQWMLNVPQITGLTKNETFIAQAWIKQHADEFDEITFQEHVGTQLDIGENFSPITRQSAAVASQKRTDIVAKRGTEVTIGEVKTRLSLSALGQLLGYSSLWHAEHPETTRIHLVAIAREALLDIPELLQAHGVHVELFPDVFQISKTAP